MIKDERPFEQRLEDIQKGLQMLCKNLRIEILPVIVQTPQAIIAQIRFVDINNKELLAKYGLEAVEDKLDGVPADKPAENPGTETPKNPLRN